MNAITIGPLAAQVMSIQAIKFDHPAFVRYWWLAASLTIVALLVAHANQEALRQAYASSANLNRTTRKHSAKSRLARACTYGALAGLLMVALGDPYRADEDTVVPSGSIHLVASFDVSNSMGSEDYREILPTPALPDGTHPKPLGAWGSRLQMARYLFSTQVMLKLPGNMIGLGTYTACPWKQSPLNSDYDTLNGIINDGTLAVGSAPGGGSDYLAGLQIGIQELRKNYDPSKRQIIVLFTDGGVTFAKESDKAQWLVDFDNTVKELHALKAEVIVVALGSKTPQMVPLYDKATGLRVGWFPLNNQKKETTAVDLDALSALANRVGGKLIWIDPDQPGQAALHVDWANTFGGAKVSQGKLYYTDVPTLAAVVLFMLIMVPKFRRTNSLLPVSPRQSGRLSGKLQDSSTRKQ